MKLIKTTIFSGFTTFIKISSGFIANKVVAVIIGPIGVGLLGQFNNLLTLVYNFGNGAINSGVVKYTAEYEGDEFELKKLFSTSIKITILFSFAVGSLVFVLSNYLSALLFKTDSFINPIRLLGITLVFYSLNSLLISIINGKKKIKLFTILNTLTSIIGLILTLVLVNIYKTVGAIYSLVIAQSLVFFISILFLIKNKWLRLDVLKIPFDKIIGNKLFAFSLMSITSSIFIPISQIYLRTLVMNRFGESASGIWQGSMRISDGYLLLITTSLTTYYLPKLSSIHMNNIELRKEIINGYKVIVPFILISSILIYLFRIQIIHLLFSSQFNQVADLIGWQFIGDFFKITSWILAFIMLAKAMTKIYIITEILFSISYIFFAYIFTSFWGLNGVSIAFAVNYFCYFITMVILFRKILFKN